MYILADINYLIAISLPNLASQPMAFSPVKLLALIVWVYLCLYVTQRIQFSPLVSEKNRPLAGVCSLFIGPVLVFILLIVDTVKKTSTSQLSLLETVKEQAKNIRTVAFKKFTSQSSIQLLDSSGRSMSEIYGHDKNKHQDSQTLKLTEQIIYNALIDRASDILIDPKGTENYNIRYRVDGVLKLAYEIDSDVAKSVVSIVKAISGMDIAEKRRPQDGSFTAETKDQIVSFRGPAPGALNGEKLSIRVLNQNINDLKLTNLGISEKQLHIINQAMAKPSGMILICGPTGSGKTTTMYGMLNEIDLYTRNVITVEDPIECVIPNASQIEINSKADITFAKSLRSILRQDPDVICVGEIRDQETAEIALRASQTGHLVLATIHCNSNAAAIVRLIDLGISPIMMASGLSLIVSQRLLRKLCDNCKVPVKLSPARINECKRKGINYKNIYQPTGCVECDNTGYKGRIAICDILLVDGELKTAIGKNEMFISRLKEEGEQKGKSNLHKQGLKKVVAGISSLEELQRVLG